ncbi:MAG: ATP-binding protein, partial [Treponema sp.]|nr:ATP-binding protein [Treponema sp.]
MQIFSFSPFGYEGALVTVEVDLRRGIPAVDIVGLADGAVRESRERMRSAIKNSNFDFPSERVLVSLSPADLKKEGAGFDLAIALAVLKAHYSESSGTESDNLHKPSFDVLPSVLVVGELELSGNVREVRAVHAAVSTAYASGISYCIVPKSCEREAREVKGMKVFASDTLSSAFYALFHEELFVEGDAALEKSFVPEGCEEVGGLLFPTNGSEYEFSVVKNQGAIVRALEIGAAGGHNIIAVGSPGSGKTLAFQKFPSLLPLLSVEDAYPVTRIYSIAGLLSKNVPLVRVSPFRMPHQTASMEGICGGGTHCLPGEISLAHNGVLFLDEAAEFKSSVLQMLRVPLEQQSITLARAGRT